MEELRRYLEANRLHVRTELLDATKPAQTSNAGYDWLVDAAPMNGPMPRAFWDARRFAGPTDFYS